MAGHVRERARGRWELRVYAGLDPVTGRKRYVTRTVSAKGKREAQRLADALALEVASGELRAGDATFGEVVEEWIATKGDGWTPATLRNTRSIVGRHLRPILDVPVHKLRTIDLDRLYRSLREEGLKASTVARVHVVVRAALEQAVRWDLIARNPASHADPGQVVETEVVPPSVEELAKLLREAEEDSPELAAFCVVAAVTGARRGALCALRWSDLDLEAGLVRFSRVISEGSGGVFEIPATSRKRTARVAALDPVTASVLAELRRRLEERARAFGVELPPDSFVFSDAPDGLEPWRPHRVSKRFRRARDRAGLPSTVRLHDLRHFMATLALASGVDVATVAGRGGWARAATLLDRYAHVLEPSDREAARLLGEAVHGAAS